MGKKGEASRAYGAAFMASMIGGIIGAIVLTVSLPAARALIMLWGWPEFLMLCVLGLTAISVLAGRHPLEGMLAAMFGLMIAIVGLDASGGFYRYSFDQAYLYDGFHLIILALGLFGLVELVDLLTRGTTIAGEAKLGKGLLDGIRDCFRHWWIVLRCSALGAVVGFIPGLGSSVANWLAYAHVVQTCKDEGIWGQGDIRGVIGPEASNNAKEGGALIPTIAFGIPGSGGMALLLAGLLLMGVTPGREMLTKNLDLAFLMVYSVALANVLATILCLALTRPLAQLTVIRVQYWIPVILILLMIGAWRISQDFGDMACLLGFGLLGWVMKRQGWPRPPLLVGFVLGPMAEKYMYYSVKRYGMTWLMRPWVIVIGLATIATLAWGLRWQRQRK